MIVKPKKLPYELFLKSFAYAPRPAVNLLVTREDGAILLTKRKKPPFAGSWHLPGSFIMKGEALLDCAQRVAEEELGIEIEKKAKKIERSSTPRGSDPNGLTGLKSEQNTCAFIGAFDDIDGDPRGHVVDLVYKCEVEKGQTLQGLTLQEVGDTVEIKFFKKLPQNIGFNHRDTLKALGYS